MLLAKRGQARSMLLWRSVTDSVHANGPMTSMSGFALPKAAVPALL